MADKNALKDPAVKEAAPPAVKPRPKERFEFIDQFRGLIGVMMALGHSNYYFNSVWHSLDPIDPFFGSWGQFALRYMGYLCAPGFLMMNGAMVYWAYTLRVRKGVSDWKARGHFMERGVFLILVQLIWVNAAWSGFQHVGGEFVSRLSHYGIIATIGASMILLTLIIRWKWWVRLAIGAALFIAQTFLLMIPYDIKSWTHVPMQLFIDSGDYNKYPILPWFGFAIMGSVMAYFWFEHWKTHAERSKKSMAIGLSLVALAWILRMGRGLGNLSPFSDFFSFSFFLEQKYPPSTVHLIWFTGAVIFMVGLFCRISMHLPILKPLGNIGKVPLFFYAVHIPLLAIFTQRFPAFYYREGAVLASFVGWFGLLAVMYPLALWFGGVKARTKNHVIKLI